MMMQRGVGCGVCGCGAHTYTHSIINYYTHTYTHTNNTNTPAHTQTPHHHTCQAYAQQVGFKHTGFLRPGGNIAMKVYEVRVACFAWVFAAVSVVVFVPAVGVVAGKALAALGSGTGDRALPSPCLSRGRNQQVGLRVC